MNSEIISEEPDSSARQTYDQHEDSNDQDESQNIVSEDIRLSDGYDMRNGGFNYRDGTALLLE